jgi:hypothetical protein
MLVFKSLLVMAGTAFRLGLLAALMVLHSLITIAQQQDCGTGPAPASHLSYLESLIPFYQAQTEDTNWIRLPVTAHVVRSSSGFGGMTETAVYATICNLNDRFASGRVSFYLSERIRFINNTAYYGATSYGPLGTMIDQENIARTINIYYTDLSGMGLCGFAYYPLSGPGGFQNDGAIVMSFGCSQPQGTTLAHEMGHYLSLPHTFDQTSNNPLDSNDAERVTRNFNEIAPRLSANCFTAGDRFCDTPSDFIAGRWPCPSSRTALDLNNDVMKPDSSYYMSYSNDNCMSRFSEQQMTAMRTTVSSTNAPRGYLTINPYPNFPSITTHPAKYFPQITDTVIPNNALFRWAPIVGASLYQIKVFQFNVNVFDTLVEDTFYHALGNRLRGMRQYSWIVRGINGGNLCTPFSPRDSFSTSTYVFAGIYDPVSTLKPHVYPTLLGPGDLLTLEGLQAGTPILLTLRDLLGRTLWSFQELNENQGRLVALPSDLPFGHYLLTCTQAGKGYFYRLLLKP